MNKILVVGAIVALLFVGFYTVSQAKSWGPQFTRGTLVGVVEQGVQGELFKIQDGANTCYILMFGKGGSALSCVK